MRKFFVATLAGIFFTSVPVLAMNHGHAEHKEMDHSMHEKKESSHHDGHGSMDHSGHGSMMEGMEMLGQCERDGVTGMAHIKAYDAGAVASMAKMGMNGTHHLMVYFEGNQEAITEGTVAVKLTDPAGNASAPAKLMLMGKGFGADIALPAKGEYTIEVGTKLKDGKKRVFEFSYDVK